MKPKVVVYRKTPDEILENIKKACDLTYISGITEENFPEFLHALKWAQGMMGRKLKVNEQILRSAPNLRIVSTIGVGYDDLDIEEMTKRGIMATNTPDVLTETVADLVMGLILAAARRIPELDRAVKEGRWQEYDSSDLYGIDVHHKTLGIIGMGKIGLAIAKRAFLGFGMNILYHNRSKSQEGEDLYKATYCDLKELLMTSDFICLMVPLNKETKGLIGEKEFTLMKKTAIFINASRGNTVDEEAMILALEKKTILAAGLDVYSQEPLSGNSPLLKLKNAVTLPHIGSATYATRFAMAQTAAANLVSGVTGRRPPNLINPEVWKDQP